QIASLGCHLSFGATFAILWFLRRRPSVLQPPVGAEGGESTLRRWARRGGVAAGVSLSATLATWPILLAWNGAVPADGLWTNCLVTPLASLVLVPAVFGGAAVFGISSPIGGPILAWAGRGMALLAEGLRAVAAEPPFDIVTGQLAIPTACLMAVGVVVCVGSRWRRRPVAVGVLVVTAALAIGVHRHAPPEDRMGLHFIPVGQGDATLARLPDGRTLLVDAGGRRLGADPGSRTVVPYLHRLGIGRLDWVIATHADFDHVGGLVAVAERMRPATFIYHPVEGARRLREVVEVMGRVGARRIALEDRRILAERPVEMRVWKPNVGAGGGDNDVSLVTRIGYGGRSALLPGDIEAAGEQWFVDRCRTGQFCGVDVVKVPHHGSKTSSTEAFLRATRPGAAVVSAGKFNAFGHPAGVVVERYEDRGVPLWETARHGLVRAIFREDGSVEVRAMRPGAAGSGE
ncbi:MAG: ComEC/Rec2 family competence protein, partial [Bradymonadaceae bacterium]